MEQCNWELIRSPWIDGIGAASVVLSDCIYVLGGDSNGPSTAQHLKVDCFDPSELTKKSITVNSCGVANRAFHSVIKLTSGALIVGGEFSDGSLATDMPRCSATDEGFVCATGAQSGVSRKGMAGCEVGPESGKVGVLFGGCNGSEYFDDIMLIKESEDGSYELHVVRLDGDKPPPRAFSSFCVCGDNNQYIVICGGCDNNRVFDDIWVLDTTKSIPALSGSAEQVAPAKAGKGTKAPAVEELMKWTQLSTQLPSERFQHSSYSFKKNDGNYAVRISGGLNRAGPLDCTPVEFTLTFGAGTPKEVTGCELTSNVTVLGRRYCGTNCTVQENGNVVGAFLFGGISDTAIPEIGFMSVSVDGASQFADRARAIIDQRKVDLDTTAAAANEELTFDRVATEFIEYPNGDKYDGEVFRPPQSGEDDGARCVPHGKGRMRFSNGSLYEGYWKMGSKCGLGQLIDETGNSFDGIFVDDNLNGDGKYTNASTREEIEGKFVNYKLEGKGFWRDQLGAIYDGEFVHNIKHGIGTLYAGCENGDTSTGRALYSGEWREGRPCGRGVLNLVVEAEGSGGLMISAQYTGDIVDGYPHGEGECIYSDGCQYVGQWRKSFRNGFGKYRSSNGDEYDGKWVADKRCGKGVWKSYRGDRYTGQWEANVPHGHGEFCYASGAVFNGGWVYGKCEGEGKMIYTDTSEFNGLWKSGAWHGHGSWRGPARSDGEVSYTGEWVNDVRNGQGVATYASGDKYKGIFLNDRPNPN